MDTNVINHLFFLVFFIFSLLFFFFFVIMHRRLIYTLFDIIPFVYFIFSTFITPSHVLRERKCFVQERSIFKVLWCIAVNSIQLELNFIACIRKPNDSPLYMYLVNLMIFFCRVFMKVSIIHIDEILRYKA